VSQTEQGVFGSSRNSRRLVRPCAFRSVDPTAHGAVAGVDAAPTKILLHCDAVARWFLPGLCCALGQQAHPDLIAAPRQQGVVSHRGTIEIPLVSARSVQREHGAFGLVR